MKDLTKGNPMVLILQFAIPIGLGNIFQLFYSLADTRRRIKKCRWSYVSAWYFYFSFFNLP